MAYEPFVRTSWRCSMTRGQADADGPHILYRFYDDIGELLYIGLTANPSRFGDHKREKWWFREVVWIRLQYFNNRDLLKAAEKAAILAEHPRHNVSHNLGEWQESDGDYSLVAYAPGGDGEPDEADRAAAEVVAELLLRGGTS